MSRPKPTVILSVTDPKTFKAEQVLASEAIFAVFYENAPINLRSLHPINDEGFKYKKVSFSNRGHAFNLATKLNNLYRTDKFAVMKLQEGIQIDEYTDA